MGECKTKNDLLIEIQNELLEVIVFHHYKVLSFMKEENGPSGEKS